jgi:hypothetical protein
MRRKRAGGVAQVVEPSMRSWGSGPAPPTKNAASQTERGPGGDGMDGNGEGRHIRPVSSQLRGGGSKPLSIQSTLKCVFRLSIVINA